jgi:hypothetical protein
MTGGSLLAVTQTEACEYCVGAIAIAYSRTPLSSRAVARHCHRVQPAIPDDHQPDPGRNLLETR